MNLPFSHSHKTNIVFLVLVLFMAISTSTAKADVAPPPPPFSSNPSGDNPNTQVQMVSEKVIFEIAPTSVHKDGQARVTAVFNMHNQGNQDEKMMVRFPLAPIDMGNCYWSDYPTINDLSVQVNGASFATTTTYVTVPRTGSNPAPAVTIPCWANFPASFPAGKDVTIQIHYTALGYGLGGTAQGGFDGDSGNRVGPTISGNISFGYVLQTGAGWYGPIGKADVIFRFPYPVTDQNVEMNLNDPAWSVSGNELTWHKEAFKPDASSDLRIYLTNPSVWENILAETKSTQANSDDGQAWARLGTAYKEAIWVRRGLRQDMGGLAMYSLSDDAYRKALSLLPKDTNLHLDYAELICWHTLWQHMGDKVVSPDWIPCIQQLKTVLDQKPNDLRAITILQKIARSTGNGVINLSGLPPDYIILTPHPTSTLESTIVTPSAAVSPTRTSSPPLTATVIISEPQPTQLPTELTTPSPITAPQTSVIVSFVSPASTMKYISIGLVGLAILIGAVFWNRRRRH